MHVNEAELDWETVDHDETGFRRKRLAAAAGGERLGCSLYELPPGERSWPFHYHTGNEEALYVLAGTGQLRTADGVEELEAGAYVAMPAGEAGAHRVSNDGDETLRYLAVSTMDDPDVTVYPDSGKIGVFAGSPPGSTESRTVAGYYRRDDEVDYWLDEA
ncbi:Cupin domain-containing protein [Haloplanus vescus]|uniref:Cupin domain-containing protein n=1 Tax=Haloplanus vescus TaxID=555874 RepID=A0A1H3ZBP9_9EURY|nr:cupin domain-containing protein [Haloplanus vescus]SEA21209.1 Cupin domain-containing protein [Haloplanus vescus]